jgi:hypothetical protein
MSAAAALVVAAALAGCGGTTYFAGRKLPPSGLTNRVMIAIQNPNASLFKGALQIVDAFYDTRYKYNSTAVEYTVSGYSGALPISIQNMPEEHQPDGPRRHSDQPEFRGVGGAESAGRVPCERQSWRIGGLGVRREFELRLLRA